MANHHRGEIDGVLDGRRYTLCLTLGALAELEAAFGDENMLALAQRFEGGRLSARNCVRILGAGLRGAGHAVSDDDVARMQADGGAAGFVALVARLLTVTFSAAADPHPAARARTAPVAVAAASHAQAPGDAAQSAGGVTAAVPFPGPT